MPIEKTSRRKPGRPRKYGQGRVNATVRFTPERYAELQAEADQNRRSLSEQVEYIVENAARDRETIADLRRELTAVWHGRVEDTQAVTEHAVEQMDKLKAMHATELKKLGAAHAPREKRLAEIVEAAVARALAKPRSPR
jgi:hypothetical protein